MSYFLLSFALWSALFIGNATASEGWSEPDNIIVFDVESNVSLSDKEVPRFQGFIDEDGEMTTALYTPTYPGAPTGFVIDSRKSGVNLWDTVSYKLCGNDSVPTKMDWMVPEGFTNLRTQVYYDVEDDDAAHFGHMRYQGSVDGAKWTNISDIDYAPSVCTLGDSCRYKMVEETKSWTTPYYHFRAIWPPPCQSELADPTERSRLSIAGEASQLGSLVLGEKKSSPSPPRDLRLTPGYERLTASWRRPLFTGGLPLLGYLVEFRTGRRVYAAQTDSKLLTYNSKRIFVPARVTRVIFSNLDPSQIYIVRVASVNSLGAGRYTQSVWGSPLPLPTQPTKTTTMAPTPYVNGTNATMAPTPVVNGTNATMAPTPVVNGTNATMAPVVVVNATNMTMAPTAIPTTSQPTNSTVPPSTPAVGTTTPPPADATTPPTTPIPVASVNPETSIESPAESSIFGVSGGYSMEMWSVLLAAVIALA